MATRFVLPSGATVTRAWNGDGFRYELAGEPVCLLADDVRALGRLVDLGDLADPESFDEIAAGEKVEREHVDPETLEVTKS